MKPHPFAALALGLLLAFTIGCAGNGGAPGATAGPTETTVSATPPPPTPNPPEPTATLPATPTPAPTATAEPARPAGFPDSDSYAWTQMIAGLSRPLALVSAEDGTGRLFILEQNGVMRVLSETGELQPEPFLDLRDRVGAQANEQGLLGLAFHPDFETNGFFYVNYTDRAGDTVIARFHAPPGATAADRASETRLLHVDQPFRNHNGGGMVFGPDGYLYLGLGDGGSAGDPQSNAQSTNTLLGKLLRVDVDGGDPYGIPPDNPYAEGGGRAEIWALGLRNPWRFTFDSRTGDLYIADVGQNAWEEINYMPAGAPPGANFGWDYREGAHSFEGSPPAGAELIDPVAEYSHSFGCSVTGGKVYRGEALPEWLGIYLYGDFCSGIVWGLFQDENGTWQAAEMFRTNFQITSFGADARGEVYLLDRGGGIYRLTARE